MTEETTVSDSITYTAITEARDIAQNFMIERNKAQLKVRRLQKAIQQHRNVMDDQVGSYECSCVYGGSTFEPDDMQLIDDANEVLWSHIDGEDHP